MSTTDLSEPQVPEVSTELDAPRPTDPGQAQHKEEQEPEPDVASAPKTRIDAIKQAEADIEGKAKEEEPKEDAKAEPVKDAKEDDGGKDEADAKGEEEPKAEPKPEAKEDVKPKVRIEPPAKFLPRAKELWANVPNEVKSEIARFTKEHEDEVAQYKEVGERYEAIRKYDDMARQNGRDLNYTLDKVVELETLMQHSPVAALNQMLIEAGPRKADGQPLSIMEVAQFIVQQGPQGYQKMMQEAQAQPAQPQGDPRVEQLQEQIRQMQEQQVTSSIIEPFRAAHPRFDELRGDIAFFLQSDKIPQSLSQSDRLSAAYDMAVRINPTSSVSDDDSGDDLADRRATPSLNGKKSITGAPSSGTDTQSRRKGRLSRSEAIESAMSELGLN